MFSKQFSRNWALRSQILMLKILAKKISKVNRFLNATTLPLHFLPYFPQRKTPVAQIHRTIYNILFPPPPPIPTPPTGWHLIPFHHHRWVYRRMGYADLITKFSWMASLPNFLTHGAPLARARAPLMIIFASTRKHTLRAEATFSLQALACEK